MEDCAEGIDITLRPDSAPPAGGLFGRQIPGGAEHLARQGQFRVRSSGFGVPQAFGQPEVHHARLVVFADQHIRGFEVAVQNSLLVRILDRSRNFLQVFDGPNGRKGMVLDHCGQARALDVIHREIVLAVLFADFVNGDNVRMVKMGRRFGLCPETAHERLAGKLAR